jgi:hypothetical protein
VKVTVTVEIENRTVTEQIITEENYRGDYREAIGECIARVELSTFGPQFHQEGHNFDEQLRSRPDPTDP